MMRALPKMTKENREEMLTEAMKHFVDDCTTVVEARLAAGYDEVEFRENWIFAYADYACHWTKYLVEEPKDAATYVANKPAPHRRIIIRWLEDFVLVCHNNALPTEAHRARTVLDAIKAAGNGAKPTPKTTEAEYIRTRQTAMKNDMTRISDVENYVALRAQAIAHGRGIAERIKRLVENGETNFPEVLILMDYAQFAEERLILRDTPMFGRLAMVYHSAVSAKIFELAA